MTMGMVLKIKCPFYGLGLWLRRRLHRLRLPLLHPKAFNLSVHDWLHNPLHTIVQTICHHLISPFLFLTGFLAFTPSSIHPHVEYLSPQNPSLSQGHNLPISTTNPKTLPSFPSSLPITIFSAFLHRHL